MPQLVGTEGDRTGEEIDIKHALTLGRSMSADIRLDDLTVSREHARVTKTKSGDYVLEDLQSGNGTFVNGERIHSHNLKDGDVVTIGNNEFQFQYDETETTDFAADQTMLQMGGSDESSSVVNTLDMQTTEDSLEVDEDYSLEQVRRVNHRLRTIYDIFRSIAGSLDEREILPKILDQLFEVFPGTERGFVIVRDPETEELVPRATKTTREEEDTRLALSDTILQFVLDKQQAVLSRDAMHDERFQGSQSIMDFEMRSVMCAPLQYEDEILGFLLLDTSKVAPSYDEEGLTLLASIANQASLIIANARMHNQLLHRERLEQDMRNASRIQHSFLPQHPPEVEGYEFVDWYDTALEVGGDFYDFIELSEDKIVIIVGDVSGKGVPAALMMAKLTGHARFHSASGLSPAGIAAELNDAVAEGNTEMFVTGLVISVDCSTNELTMVNAGHPHPAWKRADGSAEWAAIETGFPIGIVEGAEFVEETFELQPSERICLFTDGITEAMNPNKECFGEERLLQSVDETETNVAEDIVRHVQESISEHVGEAKQSDDLTFICFGPEDEE